MCSTILAGYVGSDGRGHSLIAREIGHPTEAVAAGYADPPTENVTVRDLVGIDWTQGGGRRTVAANGAIANVTTRRNGLDTPDGGYGAESEGYGICAGVMTTPGRYDMLSRSRTAGGSISPTRSTT